MLMRKAHFASRFPTSPSNDNGIMTDRLLIHRRICFSCCISVSAEISDVLCIEQKASFLTALRREPLHRADFGRSSETTTTMLAFIPLCTTSVIPKAGNVIILLTSRTKRQRSCGDMIGCAYSIAE